MSTETGKVNNFDVLKHMASENKTIMLCPDILNMDFSEKTKGTKLVVGVPGNPILSLINGEKKAVLLIWDVNQFDEMKKLLESAAASPEPKGE